MDKGCHTMIRMSHNGATIHEKGRPLKESLIVGCNRQQIVEYHRQQYCTRMDLESILSGGGEEGRERKAWKHVYARKLSLSNCVR